MKVKKVSRTYCVHCKKHTIHKVANEKQGGRNKTHPMSWGSRKRMRKRGLDRGYGNQGKISRGAIASFKRTGAKVSKIITLKLTCPTCKKSTIKTVRRAKKVELI